METTKIGNICRFENGDRGENYPSKNDFVGRGIPFINSGNISNGKIDNADLNYITEEKYNKLRAGKASKGDFVFTLRGSLGKNAIVEFDKCAIASMLVIMRPDETKIDKTFFRYAMNSPWLEKQVANVDNGSIQGNLGVSNVKDFFIPFPNIIEQKKIASILATLDNKISTNNKIIETSEKLMREIYNYWFVQFDFPDENGRPYKSSGGEMVYDEKLKREIPKGWRIFNIEDLASSVWGQCPDGINILDKDERGDDVLPYCSGAGDMDGGYIVNCQATTNASRREVEKGAILISVAGTIGKMAIANERISLGRATLGLMPKDKEYSALVWLLLKSFNHRLQTASVGAVQKIINKSNLKEINIALPEKMLDINILNDTMSLIYELSIENKKLNSLRDWLLPMLMNGQIKVSD